MATYSKASDHDFQTDADVRCDAHSTFVTRHGSSGFPEDGRRWVQVYGSPCVECGVSA